MMNDQGSNSKKGEEIYANIRKEVAEAMEKRRLEEAASAVPRPSTILRSQFPLTEVWGGALRSRTVEMRIGNEAYRFVVDRMGDQYMDEDGIVTFELWRENLRVHRHLRTLGELHNLFLPYRGEYVEVAVISIIGDEMERYKHPSVLEASMTRKAFTVSEYALNLVRVKHDHVANNITFAARFLFYALAAGELLGIMSAQEFVDFYTPNELRNIIQMLEPGQFVTRPSLEQAGLRWMAPAEEDNWPNNNQAKIEAEKQKPRKRKDYPSEIFLDDSDESEEDEDGEEEEKRKSPRRALKFEGGSDIANKIKARFNISEEDQDPELQEVAKKALMGQWNWDNFEKEDLPAAIRLARRAGITSNPPGMCQGMPYMPYRMGREAAAAEARRNAARMMEREEMPGPSLTSTASSSSALSMYVDDNSVSDSGHNNAVLFPPLPEPVPAVEGSVKKPIQVVYLDDSDTTMVTISSSLKSPRGEISMNGMDSSNDLLLKEDKEEETDDSYVMSPFLVKVGAGNIKTVSTSGDETQDPVEANAGVDDDAEEGEEDDDVDDSVQILDQAGGDNVNDIEEAE